MVTIHVSHSIELVLIAMALWVTGMYVMMRMTRH
jgi:NO-binding membrane sensor protein with MHYT domain